MEKIAICILTRGYANKIQYLDLICRNRAISKTIQSHDQELNVDYLIFHEGNINKSQQDFISRYSGFSEIKFIDVGVEFTNNPNAPSSYGHPTELSESFPTGYKSMCRFWSDRFLDYTKDYRYVARIDEDCIVTSFPIRDLIKELKSSGLSYVTSKNLEVDHPDVTVGLLQLGKDFVKSRKINDCDELSLRVNPYTNLFLMDADFYRTSEVFRDFMKAIHESNGIYTNRWGDLPIWGLAMKILGEDQIKMTNKKIVYIHGSFGEVVNGKKTLEIILGAICMKAIKWGLNKYEKLTAGKLPN
jgi:hypothetical protein